MMWCIIERHNFRFIPIRSHDEYNIIFSDLTFTFFYIFIKKLKNDKITPTRL